MPPELDPESDPNMAMAGSSLGLAEGLEDFQTECEIATIEDERLSLSEQVFSIPLILKNILKNLDKEDLLQTSLLNKYWNFFSREVLREEEKCVIFIEGFNSCQNLEKLIVLLLNSETVPFNGISFDVPMWDDPNHECIVCEDLAESKNIILEKINVKYLSLLVDGESKSNCTSFQFCRQILKEKSVSLEVLRLNLDGGLPESFSEFIGLDLKGQWLPNIKILEFPCVYEGSDMPIGIIKELVEASPQLEKIDGYVTAECLELIVPLKMVKVVKAFDFEPRINSLNICSEFSLQNPQLVKLGFAFSDVSYPDFSEWSEVRQKKIRRILKQILKSSEDTLRLLICDHSDLILMTFQWKIPALKNLTDLRLMYSRGIDHTQGYCTLRKIEWAKYFPNLKEIYVARPWRQNPENDSYIDDAFRESNAQFVCETVRKICWIWYFFSADAGKIQMFTDVFPNVKEFHFEVHREWEFPAILDELWTAWPDLESIHASVDVVKSIPNYDSLFLGVSEEEAAYLLESVEELESLEMVSTKPCIFNLQKLKSLAIHVSHDDICFDTDSTSDSDSVLLSRLAGLCAFARVVGLEVEVYRDPCEPVEYCQFSLNHLKPYVKCVD